MIILRNILLFVILVGVIFLILNIQFKAEKKRVFACHPPDTTFIQIKRPEETFFLRPKTNKDGQWVVGKRDFRVTAYSKGVKTVRALVCYLPYTERFELNPEKSDEELEVFGLKDPTFEITFTEKQTVLFSAGADTPSGTEFYLISSHDPNAVYTIPNSYHESLFLTFLDLHSKNPLYAIESGKVKFTIEEGEFNLSGAPWKEETGKISPETAEELISLMRLFTFQSFHGPMDRIETHEYGFFLPDISIQWTTSQGEQFHYEFVRFGGRFYLSSLYDGDYYLFILDAGASDKFFQTVMTLIQ